MLRKNTTAPKYQDQGILLPDSGSDSSFSSEVMQKSKVSSFFSAPGLLIAKSLSDFESARSPTSPLDVKIISNLSAFSSPKSIQPQNQMRWGCRNEKVGLGIVDSLNNDSGLNGTILGFSKSRNILFGSHLRMEAPCCQALMMNSLDSCPSPRSLPTQYAISGLKSPIILSSSSDMDKGCNEAKLGGVIGKPQCCSYSDKPSTLFDVLFYSKTESKTSDFKLATNKTQPDSGSPLLAMGSPNVEKTSNVGSSSLLLSECSGHELPEPSPHFEIELSEDYTCIISRGSNPRTTHIYGDFILDSHSIECADCNKEKECHMGLLQLPKRSEGFYLPDDFLTFCYTCRRKLEEGKDIYIYRGEKAFCSCNCRSQEILFEEKMDKPSNISYHPPKPSLQKSIFSIAMAIDI